MRAVFKNLLENAIKYSPPGGEVVISASRMGSGARFAITDHGIGIPEGEQVHIFSRFFRASNAKKKDPNGTGLGLYIAKNIIDMHHGKIWLESSEDTGTTFYFTLGV
jgi:signal transduction histidine kinase